MAFNPMVQDRSGEILAQGMAGLGNGISQGMQGFAQALEKQKRTVQNAKIAEQALKTNPELLKGLGLTMDQFSALSADDKTAKFVGTIQGLANARDQKRADVQDQEMGERLKALQGDNEANAVMPQFVAEMMKQMGGTRQPMTQQNLDQVLSDPAMSGAGGYEKVDVGTGGVDPFIAFARAGAAYPQAMKSKMMMQYMGDLTREQAAQSRQNNAAPVEYNEDPVTGQRTVRLKNMMMPSGVNPASVTQPVEMTGPDGQPTGMFAVHDKNGIRLVKGMSAAAQGKLDAGTIAQLHAAKAKTLERVQAYRGAEELYNEDPKRNPKPDPSELQDAQTDLDQINGQLRGVSAPAGASSKASTSSSNDMTGASRQNAADAIKRNPAARAGILQKLKAAGISTEGL